MAQKVFRYVATDKTNRQVTGTHKAETRQQVADYLMSRELFIVSIDQDIRSGLDGLANIQIGGISLKEKMLVSKQLATMLKAGLPVLQALEILGKQVGNKAIQGQIEEVQREVEGGTTLSFAFKKHSEIYNEVQINLLAAGEKSGNLIDVIVQMTEDLEKNLALRSKIRSAMIYPIIVFIAIIVVIIILIIFMVPTVQDLYRDFNAEDQIPGITLFLIAIADFFTNPIGLAVLAVVILISIFSFRSFAKSEAGEMVVAQLALKIPVFGNLIEKIMLSQFGYLMSMMMRSGVSILDAMAIVGKALGNPVFKKTVFDASEEVAKGVPLAVPLARSGVFPLLYIRMVSTGEQTGNLDKVLNDMGKFYEDEVNEITENLTKLLEPIILIVVGGAVAFLAVAVYLPIYSIGAVI